MYESANVPGVPWIAPFAALLLCIAILPLIAKTERWWHHNRNKLVISLALGAVTLTYYYLRGYGFGGGANASPAGWRTVRAVLHHGVLEEYLPFISLLFALYVISGGIGIRGDIPAHPLTNVAFLAIGGALASLIGTTGASMLLIRPLLATNSERKRVTHTVIFFIFIVSNIGGTLLPIGDPPLFLGYLRGVPFLWTLALWKEWAFTTGALLVIYYVWDVWAYRHERPKDIRRDELQVQPFRMVGGINFLWLGGVVLATALLDPTKPLIKTSWTPYIYLREALQLVFVILSLKTTPRVVREENNFNYTAILEVACLFVGIFVCMQPPIEILDARGASLGLDSPAKFFWATGALSSFLDNAPTYVVFFEAANSMTHAPGAGVLHLLSGHFIREDLLIGVSLGAVFMGAMTYIGNGPNFMVKSIAEHEGVKMPSFFGYMVYSGLILIPLFLIVARLFLWS
jgi:Na+/H+ antiporter NhaD/arsenite permease-like protein